ncbi:DNA-J related domain-containing protein [Candidatus Venteria ishoeyi]|uniref:DNA-J related protein n=1 Tax=Candidatus Venteria ishoeyi TaxID=1899563 RepID=A0A1H6FGC5_9GAMM|nr:DNA-J related domain-containing protein [Candidatus Venteria ishoeyi]SEH08085.1 DNA-J related protein [Candidatus Venteria ishoeyi]
MTTNSRNEASKPLHRIILNLLRNHPAGLGEYELLKALQQAEVAGFPPGLLSEPLLLFQMHFRLFHQLYQLRDQLWEQQAGHLEISPLNICLQIYQPGHKGLMQHDPLHDYYLDINHLENTTEADVQTQLQTFWVKFYAGEQRFAALAVLGLKEPIDYAAIRYRYRQLAAKHHPDRGGDTQCLQKINQAMDTLEKYYR